MKAVMISVPPKQCENILNGSQTILPKKTTPNLQVPFKCYIYCTKEGHILLKRQFGNEVDVIQKTDIDVYNRSYVCNSKVIGEFICNEIEDSVCDMIGYYNFIGNSCSSVEELWQYGQGVPLYGWHISDIKIYNKPKELSEFLMPCKIKKHIDDYSCLQCDYLVDSDFGGYCGNVVVRPPQSWCYVEEIKCKKIKLATIL